VDPETLLGARVGSVQRRGKYLWLPLENSGGLLMHLGMSGSLAFLDATPAPGAHDHFDLHTDRGLLRLTDPRRFGAVVWGAALDAEPVATLLAGLGLEPFDDRFDGLHLHAALSGRRVAIKQALLAGDIVVGAGNIYACEALFMAGIDPRLPAGKLSRPRADKLAAAVRQVLGQALEAGGTTLRDFRDAHGVAGSFQMQAQVYGREGEPCRRCGTLIKRIVQGARSTFFCPQCQKR
jgi:formamidopyrimidine-DNA glycosylase